MVMQIKFVVVVVVSKISCKKVTKRFYFLLEPSSFPKKLKGSAGSNTDGRLKVTWKVSQQRPFY